MWKRMLIGMVREIVQQKILDYVLSLAPVEKKADAITLLKDMKNFFSNSRSSTTRAIGRLIPFEDD